MRSHILILEGHVCKTEAQERFLAFLRHLGEQLDLTIEPMAGPRWSAPNPGVLSRDGGAFAWSFWSDASATVIHDEAVKKVTMTLQTATHIGFSDADILFRSYFDPQEVRNCLPVLSSGRG